MRKMAKEKLIELHRRLEQQAAELVQLRRQQKIFQLEKTRNERKDNGAVTPHESPTRSKSKSSNVMFTHSSQMDTKKNGR